MSAKPATPIHFEDLTIGRTYHSAAVEITEDEITRFAARYDPQPFHLDPVAAKESVFGGLVASGWLTAALTMRLMVGSELEFGTGVVGLGVDTLQWPKSVRPGDVLSAGIEVIATRTSASKPDFGIVKIRTTTTNQRGEIVQTMVSNILVRRRPG